MNGNEKTRQGFRQFYLQLLKAGLLVAERIQPSELQVTLFWAGLVGFFGASSAVLFRKATESVHWLLTQQHTGLMENFAQLPQWQRLVTPIIGGALAGGIIALGTRFNRSKSSTDYMEAIVLGDGTVSFRASIVKSASALFTIASGGSIGREGPLVQLSAMIASLVGRWRKWPTTRCRLIVACGAAAGIASAYNAPIAGALFVAEIVLGSLAMENFGPLVFSSVVATLTTRQMLGQSPLYKIPPFQLNSNWEIFPYLALGVAAGFAAPWFLRLLRFSETLFDKSRLPLVPRLALGGAVVGAIAVFFPMVCGNGYSGVNDILDGKFNVLDGNAIWHSLLLIFLFKIIATGATFGSGAVGGVFTPTLFVGASFGWLFGAALHFAWPASAISPSAFALVGMGAFLAATTHAPIMAMLMLFELTLDYQIILPLMLVCVVAFYISSGIEKNSIYSESLQRKGVHDFDAQLARLRVRDLMKANPQSVLTTARFHEIAESFITQRFNYLYVVDTAGRFVGAVSLHDIKSYLQQPEMLEVVIAGDIVRENFSTITPDVSLSVALEAFSRHDGERMPVVSSAEDRKLIGHISKTDLLIAIAQRSREGHAAAG